MGAAPHRSSRIAWAAQASALLVMLCSCGHLLEDNGTHLADTLEKGAAKLRASGDPELVVRYETLDGRDEPYYVEITPSVTAGQPPGIRASYLVVSGKTAGGTSYHNRFVVVPRRLYVEKTSGGPAELLLRKEGEDVAVVEVR